MSGVRDPLRTPPAPACLSHDHMTAKRQSANESTMHDKKGDQ